MAMGSQACAQTSRKNARMFNPLKRKTYDKELQAQVVYKITFSKVSNNE